MAAFRPGTNVITEDTAPPISAPTSTGTWFVAGLAEKGPVGDAVLVQSLSDFKRLLGQKVSYSVCYDTTEHYFNEGGGTIWFSRAVGPAAVSAALVLKDGTGDDTMSVEAKSPGAVGDAIQVTVTVAGGNFTLTITDGTTIETGTFATKQAAYDWATFSNLVNLLDESASPDNPAALVATHLTGGDDDRSNVDVGSWQNALEVFTDDFGAGQVSIPGIIDVDVHQAVEDHCMEHNRAGILDLPSTGDKATLELATSTLKAEGSYAASFAPWLTIPASTAGVQRVVPPCALIAGLCARNDPVLGPNAPSAGGNGISLYATGVVNKWSDPDRQDLNAAGVNVIRMMFNGRQIRVYGWRSLADPVGSPNWRSFGNTRLRMALAAEGNAVMENFMFDQIDGAGVLFSELAAALGGMLQPFWVSGQLYGRNPSEAFLVDVGSQVNTSETISNLEIHAVIRYRDSPFVEYGELVFVKRPITLSV